MQPPGGDGRGGNNPRGRVVGGFPGFGDPFAAFGRPSFLSDMFENDPFFNDPFFTRPFGSLFGNSGGLFGPGGFFGQNPFPPTGFQSNARQIPIDERPYYPPPETARRGVHIEELPEDHDDGVNSALTSNREPIIEHPEDDDPQSTGVANTEITRYQPEPPAHRTRTSNTAPRPRSTNTPFTYSYQSSSVTYGGANGPYYAAHSSRRRGPDGVYEEQHAEKDMTKGKETHKVLHGLGNKGRALTRKRNAEGREEQFETLHNLDQGEVPNFEKTWETQAEKAFPRYKSSSQRLGSGSGTTSRAALPSTRDLPSNGGSSSKPDSRPGPKSGSSSVPKSSSRPKTWPSAGSKSQDGPPSNGAALRFKGDFKGSKGEGRGVSTE